ncbi:hypothetical protein M1247_04990 [Mycobacterium sp. 21AC1]|uniref:DUF6542 domain-containing protein n=1 Tax=[Mycobacterium] appelbergii TaxID=2939269 RepID=UPI0029393A4A|nr:DUF6542 domain-containing protein [Mycobacterium sp. 21AC1]MDV3124260.1 hypothetical protein [Mycobacterium sp. 21AC1]
MSGLRAQPAVPADHRSVHPKFPGVPWWGAVLLAVTATAIGFAFDAGSGSRELSSVFAVCYVLGALAAVLVVRQSGVFTAVIQPPLILFFAVPGSYFLFHGGQLGGVKDLAINCGYPLIERFPLMLFTSAAVLLIGLGRWYFSLTTRGAASVEKDRKDTQKSTQPPIVAAVTAKISGLLFRKPATRRSAEQDPAAEPSPRRRSSERPSRRKPATAQGARAERKPTKRSAASRSRTGRLRDTEFDPADVRSKRDPADVRSKRDPADVRSKRDPDAMGAPERPRRPRPPRASEPPLVPPAEPRRRVRTQPREPRKQPPADRRGAASPDRAQRRRRFDDYQPFEEPFDARPTNGHGAGRSTHHPVSRVRYRGAEDDDNRAEYRSRRRSTPPDRQSRSWEYDA